jgi:aminoglycoside 6'-N-acetyltransferase
MPHEDASTVLRGPRVTLRRATADDAEPLAAIMAAPAVAQWWGPIDVAGISEELPGSFAIVIDGEVCGWLLVGEEDDPEFRHVAFDIAVATDVQGRGYGPEALRVIIRHYIERGHHRFTIDPAADNEHAIRAYRTVGFRPVGILREYWHAPDGRWRDGLLMDLLAAELTD